MAGGVRSSEVCDRWRFASVRVARLSEVRKCWRCAVVGGARCGWGFVGGVVGGRWTVDGFTGGGGWWFRWWCSVDGCGLWFAVVVGGSGIVVLYVSAGKFHR